MYKKSLDVQDLIEPNTLASEIGQKFTTWNSQRSAWLEEKKELRNYVYATDTTSTSNKKLPWSNSTTSPKLTQIYDNLKANYTAALFPNMNWMKWQGEDDESTEKTKTKIIQAYMENKTRNSKFISESDKIVDDYIIYGNCFATVEFASEYAEVDGEFIPQYIGPRMHRISPYDIVFDPTASSFRNTPKIIRSLVGLGQVKQMAQGDEVMSGILEKMEHVRREVGSYSTFEKTDAFIADGFGSIEEYYRSGSVEVLTFYGDLYDIATGTIKTNHKIVVLDRAYVIYDKPIASWLGTDPIVHAGWRTRPDNLYCMGPLDNLVGMQYRIDHLENLKADVFDMIALPILKIRGDIQDFDYEPGAKVWLGEEGDVEFLRPDGTALQADFQIQVLENKMEEMAGAPRQAMGIRTPGEKTAFEVETLQNSASRIFQHKAAQLEREFFEPVLNSMLESARRNMDTADLIRIFDEELDVALFDTITKEDLTAKGKIVPLGARHFAERAQRVQNINQLLGAKQDPSVGVHISGKEVARILTEEIGEPKLFGENIAAEEGAETQLAMQDAEADAMEEAQIAAEEGL